MALNFQSTVHTAEVVELGGKNLMLGTVDERNCPFTYHHVQEKLGQTRGHPFSGLLETTYMDDSGNRKKYVMRELGGCTAGVHKSWGYHLAANAVRFGRVGRSLSALVDARKSAESSAASFSGDADAFEMR